MKNKFIKIFAPLSALILTSCGTKTYDAKDYILEMNWKDNFRILQLNDLHIGNKDDQQLQFDFVDQTINDANADLIVLDGDVFTFADRVTAKRVFKWMDSHKIPWTVTWGNHDEQCYFSIDWVTGYLNDLNDSDDSYCIFKDIQDDDVMGNANFAINLMKDGHVKEQLIVMDSNRYNYGKYKDYDSYVGYDAFHDDQVEWYEKIVKYTTAQNGGTVVPSLAFFHIPFPEYDTAYSLYLEGSSEVELVHAQSPLTGEGVACPMINTHMFEKMVELGSTNGTFVAHDHKNNWAVKYKGITLSYGVNSTDRVYMDKNLLGGQVIEVKDDGSFELTQILKSFDSYKEFY
ncbi:MAG: metallophosphoesterase [Bacilli bacterium]|nr:metallophosphoesterase [Bacilli bacterium]